LLGYAACMRENGVNMADPTFDADGNPTGGGFGPNSGIDPRSDAFQAAQQACGDLLQGVSLGGRGPGGGFNTEAIQNALNDFTACLRDNGVQVDDITFGPRNDNGGGNNGGPPADGSVPALAAQDSTRRHESSSSSDSTPATPPSSRRSTPVSRSWLTRSSRPPRPRRPLDTDEWTAAMRRASATVLSLVMLGAGGAGGYYLGTRDTESQGAAKTPVALTTAKVQQLDLATYDDTTATLGFTTSVTVSSPVAGTVTSLVTGGDTVDAGSVVATIDGAPVVAMVGDIPTYRDLSTSSTDGPDVRELELNLVQLGFDTDHAIVVDNEFDAGTKAAVTAFEDSIGLTGDGKITRGELVFMPGRLLVDTVSASVGGSVSAGSALIVGRQAERKYLVAGISGATIDHFAAPETGVGTGTVLFWSNGFPVTAIEGDAAAVPALTRELAVGVNDGADVKLYEQMLKLAGFDAEGTLTVDDHFDDGTATATVAWLGSLGIAADATAVTVPRGAFTVVPAGLRVGSPTVSEGATLEGDAVVLSLTAPARQVTTTAPIGDDTFELGGTIDVEFPDGTVEPGTVVEVGNVATNTSNEPGATPSVSIVIGVESIPSSVDGFVEIPVTLRVVTAQVPDAIVVPVSALVALKEGGYGVQVVSGKNADGTDQTRLVGVTPGLFTNGFVQVEGELTAGADVVVPS
jgi:hypothetical protein